MCKAGYKELSWFIVLIPFVLFFVFFAMVVYKTDSYQEGMKIKKKDEKKISKVVKKIKKKM
tara:strand:- start:556 stop:738 length:183 start_codon:yes stop_codon:yes gene_type:complete